MLDPIEDAVHVDSRRTEVGLPPLAEYLKQIDAMYKHQPAGPAAAEDDGRR